MQLRNRQWGQYCWRRFAAGEAATHTPTNFRLQRIVAARVLVSTLEEQLSLHTGYNLYIWQVMGRAVRARYTTA